MLQIFTFKIDHLASKQALVMHIQTTSSRVVYFIILGQAHHFHVCAKFPTLR
jgi:hypothetical protein